MTYKLVLPLLLAACAPMATSERAAKEELCPSLPSVSVQDTDQTIIEVDNFNALAKSVLNCK